MSDMSYILALVAAISLCMLQNLRLIFMALTRLYSEPVAARHHSNVECKLLGRFLKTII